MVRRQRKVESQGIRAGHLQHLPHSPAHSRANSIRNSLGAYPRPECQPSPVAAIRPGMNICTHLLIQEVPAVHLSENTGLHRIWQSEYPRPPGTQVTIPPWPRVLRVGWDRADLAQIREAISRKEAVQTCSVSSRVNRSSSGRC